MYIKLVHFIILVLALSFVSCSSLYMPNVPATPMFQNQGEIHVAAHANIKGNVSGNLGVAVGNHLAIIANGSYIDQSGNNNRNELFKQYLIEGGLGYFTKIGKEKRQVLEIYGGYGRGSSAEVHRRASTTGMQPVETQNIDFDKIFVQINYSSTRRKKLNLFGKPRTLNYGTAIRASRVDMTAFLINNLSSPEEEALFIEPLFYTRMELNNGFQVQYTNGFNFNVVDNTYLKAGNAVFTLGLTYNFGRKISSK